MSHLKKPLLFVLFPLALALSCCKKSELIKPASPTENYFYTPPGVPVLIKQIALRIRAQEKQENFLEGLIKHDGYALWDKSEIFNPSHNETVVYIPLVLKNSRQVTSYIIYRQKEDQAMMKLIRGSTYLSYGFQEGFNANVIALDLMYMNQLVFGDNIFQINNGELLRLKNMKGLSAPYMIRLVGGNKPSGNGASSMFDPDPYVLEGDPGDMIIASPVLPTPCQRVVSFEKCTGFITDNGPKNCKKITIAYTPGGVCGLPPLPPTSPSVPQDYSNGGLAGTGTGFAGLPGLNVIMPPCPVGMSQQVCDEQMIPVLRYTEPGLGDPSSFDNLESPVDEPDEPLLDNGIGVEDIASGAPSGGTPRIIGRTRDRGNTKDLAHGRDGDVSHIRSAEAGKSNDELFDGMKDLFGWCTIFDSELKGVGDLMIEKFRTNTSTDHTFTNPVLNSKVHQSHSMINFLKSFGADLQKALIINGGNIENIGPLVLPYRPQFTGRYNKFHGLQILLNDTEYTEIQLDHFELYGGGRWAAEVTVTINDHFGLDKDDALSYQYFHRGFADWWLLQHTRNYVPFKTKIVVRKRILGNL